MTKIVVDTNIVFSALLNTNSKIGQILINENTHFDFYSLEYVRFEITKRTAMSGLINIESAGK